MIVIILFGQLVISTDL